MSIRRTNAASQRTPEERERARQERERRRLEAQGLPVPPADPPAAQAPDAPANLPAASPEDAELDPPTDPYLAPVDEPEPDPLPEPEVLPEPEPDPLPEPEPELEPLPQLPPRVRRSHLHRPHLHRPHVHRPHLRRPHAPRQRSLTARLGAIASLLVVLAAIAAGALVIERHIRHKPLPAPAVVKVTIPEGSTAVQISELAHADGLRGDYAGALRQSTQLRPSLFGASSHEHNLEGFLFPATYELYAGASVTKLVSDQLAAFTENFGTGQMSAAKALGVTPYQLLTVASMVEREASLSRERPLVAAVIFNRLRQHMPLGIDATIRYALHNYSRPLTEAQLHSSSPYNTRTHTGLPPTPISNPGLESIEAAAHPAHVSYLYYVARADGCPGQVFSSSYAQFQRDAAAYQDALSRDHGRVPTCRSR